MRRTTRTHPAVIPKLLAKKLPFPVWMSVFCRKKAAAVRPDVLQHPMRDISPNRSPFPTHKRDPAPQIQAQEGRRKARRVFNAPWEGEGRSAGFGSNFNASVLL